LSETARRLEVSSSTLRRAILNRMKVRAWDATGFAFSLRYSLASRRLNGQSLR